MLAHDQVHRQWPCQRLRLAIGAILFFVFETLIGQQLPRSLAYMILGLGVASAVSAYYAVRTVRLHAQVAAIRSAFPQEDRR